MTSSTELKRSYSLILLSTIFYSMFSLSQWAISINLICLTIPFLQSLKIVRKLKPNLSVLIFLLLNILVLVGGKEETSSSLIQAMLTLYLSSSLMLQYRRINYQISLVSCFLILGMASKEVFSTINIVIMIVFYSLITWTLFLNQNVDRSVIDFRRIARNLIKILFQISPIIIVIFVWLPQYVQENPFQFQGQSATVGLSDSLRPGSISKLIATNDIFFIAKTKPVKKSKLYWKTSYLDNQFGMKWFESNESKKPKDFFSYPITNKKAVQIVALNDSSARLPFLGSISRKDSSIRYLEGGSFNVEIKNRSILTYEYGDYFSSLNSKLDYLQTEDLASQKARELALRIKSKFSSDPSRTISYLKAYIISENFIYTLKPQNKSKTIDQFLFRDKTGYCEHYASAFAYLLRKSGIKTRVVLGFQGGSFNERLNFYSVYSRDAHSWIEYWDEGQWKMFDPTYILAPSRIDKGFNYFFREQSAKNNYFAKLTLPIVWFIQDLSEDIRSNLQFLWNTFLDLFSRNSIFNELTDFISLHSSEMLMMLMLLLFWLLLRRKSNTSEIEKRMNTYSRLLLKKSYVRLEQEGYKEFTERFIKESGFEGSKHREFISIWMKAYYSEGADDVAKMDKILEEIRKELS